MPYKEGALSVLIEYEGETGYARLGEAIARLESRAEILFVT